MSAIPPSERVFFSGVTGAGKSHALRELYLVRCPRALIIDPLGEHRGDKTSKVYHVQDVAGVRDALRRAPASGPRWQIIANIDPRDVAHLAPVLIPPVLTNGNAYPLLVGGMALVCDELDLIAPTYAKPEIVGLWRRGRHVGLTILGATQRPHGVARIITAMSQFLVICATDEPADVEYLRDVLPAACWARLASLPFRELLVYSRPARKWYHFGADYKVKASG